MQTHPRLCGDRLAPAEAGLLRTVADAELFDGRWIPEKFQTLHYLGGNKYVILDCTVQTPATSGRAN